MGKTGFVVAALLVLGGCSASSADDADEAKKNPCPASSYEAETPTLPADFGTNASNVVPANTPTCCPDDAGAYCRLLDNDPCAAGSGENNVTSYTGANRTPYTEAECCPLDGTGNCTPAPLAQ